MIEAVMFDFWGTLVTGKVDASTLLNASRHGQAYLQKKGYNLTLEEYEKRRQKTFAGYEELATKGVHLTPEEAFRKFFFYDTDISDEDLEKVINMHEIYDFDLSFREDCGDVLRELKARGCKIALVTNSWVRQSKYWLKKTGLEKYFDAVIISCDIGVAKPDKKIFEIASEKLGVPLSKSVYVGDTHKSDISGAHNAGMACAIAIEPFKRDDSLAPPTAIVKALSEIIPIIKGLK